MTHIKSLFDPRVVIELNKHQHSHLHPFTCGDNRGSAEHREYAQTHGGDFGALIATRHGWECPTCHYRQDWHSGTVTGVELYPTDIPFWYPTDIPFWYEWMAIHPFTRELEPYYGGVRQIRKFYCIYDHPADYPDNFVVRQWDIYEGINDPVPNEHRLTETLVEARELALAVLVGPDAKGVPIMTEKDLEDDPYIVETWTTVK